MPAKSVAQQRLMGMAHACQKYGKCASKEVKDLSKRIEPKDAEDFARTKHKGLPKRKGKKKMQSYDEWDAEQRNEGLLGGAAGAVIGGAVGGAPGAVAGGYLGHKATSKDDKMKKGMKKDDKKKAKKNEGFLNELAPVLAAAASGAAMGGGMAVGKKVVNSATGNSNMKKNMKNNQKKMKSEYTTFKDYAKIMDNELNEVGTSTADVALFKQRVIPGQVRRLWDDSVDEFFKKKKNSSQCWLCGDK